MSMSVFPFANAAQQGGGITGNLTLNTLSSTDFAFLSNAQSGVRTLSNGDVEEIVASSWTAQNSGTEWVDDGGASANLFEVQLVQSGAGLDLPTGPTLGDWNTCDATRQWTLTTTVADILEFTGTMTIREIADTGNSVNASVSLTSTREDN